MWANRGHKDSHHFPPINLESWILPFCLTLNRDSCLRCMSVSLSCDSREGAVGVVGVSDCRGPAVGLHISINLDWLLTTSTMPFKDFLNLHPTVILTLFLTSQPSADADQDFSSKTSDGSVTNALLDQEYSDLQPEYSKPQPEFSKLEPQYSDTAYSNSGPTAAFLPLDDKVSEIINVLFPHCDIRQAWI